MAIKNGDLNSLDHVFFFLFLNRSTEEIFALFISIAFAVDAFRDVYKSKLIMVKIENQTQLNVN